MRRNRKPKIPTEIVTRFVLVNVYTPQTDLGGSDCFEKFRRRKSEINNKINDAKFSNIPANILCMHLFDRKVLFYSSPCGFISLLWPFHHLARDEEREWKSRWEIKRNEYKKKKTYCFRLNELLWTWRLFLIETMEERNELCVDDGQKESLAQ